MKIINKYILFITLTSLFVLFTISCQHSNSNESGTDAHGHSHGDEGQGDEHEDEHEDGVIHLSLDQIETMSIAFGDFTPMKINDFVAATGTLGLPPNAVNSVSARASGYINDSRKFVEGDYINKGKIIAYIENPEFIEEQRKYLELAAALAFDHQELERQKALVAANAGIAKNVQQLEAQINMKTVSMKGITKQLAYLGISTEQLTTESIVQKIAIYAQMSGYVTAINMHDGMYVTPQLELMEIINEEHLHLELDVFEKDVARVKKHQKISYSVPALGDIIYAGEVHVLGREFNAENKTVRIHGHLEKEQPRFIKDLFVEAKIWLNNQTVDALPDKAIIKDGASSYIFVANRNTDTDELEFEKIMVIPGSSDNGFTAVKLIDPIPEGMEIVTDGAYYVYAQSVVGELEHSH